MNKARRARLAKISAALTEQFTEIETVRDEERDYFDNMPESLQEGEKGRAAEESADSLDDICGELEDLISRIAEIAEAP